MPELSDVEGFRRHFHRYASRRRINGVAVADPMLVRNASAAALARGLAGRPNRRLVPALPANRLAAGSSG